VTEGGEELDGVCFYGVLEYNRVHKEEGKKQEGHVQGEGDEEER
jgi:hypothetical protein